MLQRIAEVIQALRAEPALKGGWRPVLGLVAALAFSLLLLDRLGDLDPQAILVQLHQVPPAHWALALGFTAISFAAVAGHDETLHRHLATGIRPAAARRAGLAAIALSQALGLGLVTGALVRWRMLPGLRLGLALKLTLAVSIAFLAGWAVLAALVLVLSAAAPGAGGVTGAGRWAAAVGLAAAGLAAASVFSPRRGWPGLRVQMRVAGLVAIDVGAAALAFWALAPDGVPLGQILPAVVLAIGAGLVSGAPGGLGAVELTLIALLPAVPEAALLASILAWRLVYFLLPALVGLGLVILGPGRDERRAAAREAVEAAAGGAGFAEAGLMRQGVFQPVQAGLALWPVARLPNTLVALRQPLSRGAVMAADCRALAGRARAEGRGAVLYKVPARVAVAARQAGWAVLALAREAWLDPQEFRLEGPARAGLRRKLRRAAEAGVIAAAEPVEGAETEDAGGASPGQASGWADLAALNATWIAARGGEMGFSMGRFDPGYLAGQRLYLARQAGRLVGFASFHISQTEWTLDLLRPHPAAPDGTAQALIAAALADAARAGLRRLSLAAVPEAAFPEAQGAAATAGRRMTGRRARQAGAGLHQFKAGFAPAWDQLYIAAPAAPDLALAAVEIRKAVTRPGPLPAQPFPPSGLAALPVPHAAAAEIEIASSGPTWHRKSG